jgi:hypothetical protein
MGPYSDEQRAEGGFEMPIAGTRGLFLHELCELYDAEHRFVEGQEEMAQEATDGKLESALREHLAQTRVHARNLEEVFRELGEEPRRETNEVAQSLVSEAQEGIREAQSDALCDCAIDAAVIKGCQPVPSIATPACPRIACRGARRCHSRGCRLVLRGVGNPR